MRPKKSDLPLPEFIASDHLPRVPRQSSVVVNVKGDNAVTQGAVHCSPEIWLTPEENPGKPRIGDATIKAVQSVIASNRILYLRMRSEESQSTSKWKLFKVLWQCCIDVD